MTSLWKISIFGWAHQLFLNGHIQELYEFTRGYTWLEGQSNRDKFRLLSSSPAKFSLESPRTKLIRLWQVAGRKTLEPTQWIHNFWSTESASTTPEFPNPHARVAEPGQLIKPGQRDTCRTVPTLVSQAQAADHLGHTWGPMFSWTRPHSRDMNSFKRLDGLPSSLSSYLGRSPFPNGSRISTNLNLLQVQI